MIGGAGVKGLVCRSPFSCSGCRLENALEPTSKDEGLFIQASTVFGHIVIKLLGRDTHITHEETEPPKVNYSA